MEKQNIKLDYNIPAFSSDGNAILARNDGVTELIFFQLKTNTSVENGSTVPLAGQAVAALRLNEKQLKALAKAIEDHLKKNEQKKAAKTKQ